MKRLPILIDGHNLRLGLEYLGQSKDGSRAKVRLIVLKANGQVCIQGTTYRLRPNNAAAVRGLSVLLENVAGNPPEPSPQVLQ